MVRRLHRAFASLKGGSDERREGFIPFIMAGDPEIKATEDLIHELSQAGATAIEIGVPFSDAVADGPVIQRAAERALRSGTSVSDVLTMIARVRKRCETPLVVFSYFNPLLQFGLARFASEAARAGADAVLVTDLVPEEAEDFARVLRQQNLDMIFLVAPTTTDVRLQMIAERASGFIYAVSRTGVTGERDALGGEAERLVERVRAASGLPVAVGFGISTRGQVRDVCRYADAAVVGSAIVAEMSRLAPSPDVVPDDFAARIGAFARALIKD
jgi:tryptophan synthase alpha chain